MINNIWFKIIAEKLTQFRKFYTIFARKMLDYITRHEIEARPRPKPRGRGRGQNFDLEATLASRT